MYFDRFPPVPRWAAAAAATLRGWPGVGVEAAEVDGVDEKYDEILGVPKLVTLSGQVNNSFVFLGAKKDIFDGYSKLKSKRNHC